MKDILAASEYAAFQERLARSDCRRCPLGETRTRIVVDRGTPQARLLVVGEAPGAAEDASGVAFCGRAGTMLDRLVADAGLSPGEDLLIVNVVKCRPPGNRAPTPEEAEACRPFLDKQLGFSPARMVALLGRTALRRFAPDRARRPMGEQAGRFFRIAGHPGREFAVLYHPAAILYNRRLEPTARRHMEAVAARLSTGTANAGG